MNSTRPSKEAAPRPASARSLDLSAGKSAFAAQEPFAHERRSFGNQAALRGLGAGDDPVSSGQWAAVQSLLGNQGILRRLQAKLTINQPGDQYEQEADRVADQVMRMPDPTPAVSSAVPGVQRKCSCGGSCDKCRAGQGHEHLQMKRVGSSDTGRTMAPPIVHEVLRSPGQPLDPATRAFMEPRFGEDFSQVRLHTDQRAGNSARAVNALAYAAGRHLVFGMGQFSPTSRDSLKLLAHELTHVVQQREGGAISIQREPDLTFSDPTRNQRGGQMREQTIASQARSDLYQKRWGLKEMQRCIEGCHFSSTEERRWYAKYFLSEYYILNDGAVDSDVPAVAIVDAERKFQASRSVDEVADIPDTAGSMRWVDDAIKTPAKRQQEREDMVKRAEQFEVFKKLKASIDQLSASIPADWMGYSLLARSIGRKRPNGYYASLAKDLLENGQRVVDNIRKRADRAIGAASANNQKQFSEDVQVLRGYIAEYRENVSQVQKLSREYEELEKLWAKEPKNRLIDGKDYDKRLYSARSAAKQAHLDFYQHFDRLTAKQVWESGKFDPTEKDRVFADQNELIGEAVRERHEQTERDKQRVANEREDAFVAGAEAAKHNELFLQPFGAEGLLIETYNAAQLATLTGQVVNACREGVGQCVETAGPAIVIGVVTHKAMKSGGVADPVKPAPEPPRDVLAPGVAGSQDQAFWTGTKPTTANPTVGKIAPGEKPVTDISAAKKQPPASSEPKVAARNDNQPPTQQKKAMGQNQPLEPRDPSPPAKPRKPAPPRPPRPRVFPPDKRPVVNTYTSNRSGNRGASYEIRGDAAEFDASRRSGYQVYEYLNEEGDLLYVGKSGGIKDPSQNWADDRLQNSHINTDWIASAKRVRVYYGLSESEMWALEEVRIPESIHKDANVKVGEYSRKYGDAGLGAAAQAALDRPNALFAIEAVPVR